VAKRRRPDPAITEKWVDVLRPLARKLAQRREAEQEVLDDIGVAVRGAFSEGVLVGPLKEATGLSGSRLYQLKFALRDQEKAEVTR
jgi:hypothetical protein